jgi:hypothetical protein
MAVRLWRWRAEGSPREKWVGLVRESEPLVCCASESREGSTKLFPGSLVARYGSPVDALV